MTTDPLYPESPGIDKSELTQITPQYRNQIIINLFAIILFFVLYLAMITGAGLFIYLAVDYPLRVNATKWEVLLKIGVIAMSVMFFLFLLKALFKGHSTDNPMNTEIEEQNHPELFKFIRRLSEEVGAAFPKKIFVNHEINASVFYNSTVLSLFLPTKKNLLIGLGLVNSVNLSEFKAIMAHEFGHFAQSSMKLGSYVYMANRIVYDMVYERDRWDELLERWKNLDGRLAIFAWLLSPFIWLVRQLMAMLYQALNALHSGLSKQMEFNADLVAVSVTGSDQIVNSLYKIGQASQSFDYTMNKLSDALDQKMMTEDLFYNHLASHKELIKVNAAFAAKEFESIVKHRAKGEMLFEKDEGESTLVMYASHPSDYLREKNAKQKYIEGPFDDRSPWLLFGNADVLANRITENLYSLNLNKKDLKFNKKEEVQRFINEELTEGDFSDRYKLYYDRPSLLLPTKEERLLASKTALTQERLKEHLGQLWDETFSDNMTRINAKMEKHQEVLQFLQHQPKNGSIEVAGKSYKTKEAMLAFHAANKEIEDETDWLQSHDQKVCECYLQISSHLNPDDQELLHRYDFEESIKTLIINTDNARMAIENEVHELAELSQPEESDIQRTAGKLSEFRNEFAEALNQAKEITVPSLKNIENLGELHKFLLPEAVTPINAYDINYDRLGLLMGQMENVTSRAQRLAFKNRAALIVLQEKLETQLQGS